MFEVRDNEPEYALLKDPDSKQQNRYGTPIEKAREGEPLFGQSLNINGDPEVGTNPNRYKQHGFYFNADNCIACHACEAACSEKNDNPAHIAFRSVGFVEGGTYPAYSRINISMACNHCDNPVCLKGCPTRAYTKFAEYGAVLQDPDICFGCGYCTWVCPYNAPQLDPIKGQVTKCNMCVDRLEVGLKPACVSACLGKALDFGVIENIPEGRSQAKTSIPGFPTPEITHPNIRFQQTRTLQRDMVRVDTTPLKYHRDDTTGEYKPVVDPKHEKKRHWNLKKLFSSHENSHIIFTLATQTVIGAFLLFLFGGNIGLEGMTTSVVENYWPVMISLFALMSYGMLRLNLHLGKPLRFYRGFNNLKLSPVSREIAGVSLFFMGFAGFIFLSLLSSFELLNRNILSVLMTASAAAAVIGALIGLYYMIKLYLIPARPYWNHWQTASSFISSVLVFGSLSIAVISSIASQGLDAVVIQQASYVVLAGLVLEAAGLLAHARAMKKQQGEGAASHFEQTTTYGKTYLLRNVMLAVNIIVVSLVAIYGLSGTAGAVVGTALTLSILFAAMISRALFYVLVIPTTMPGAFFWRNKGFVEHAREVGLAEMPQLGVVPDHH